MKRWTNGLPGATKRLGAMMALRGLSVSESRMRADTHIGPEHMLHFRGLIHCCSSHVRRSRNAVLLHTAGPYILARRDATDVAPNRRYWGYNGRAVIERPRSILTLFRHAEFAALQIRF